MSQLTRIDPIHALLRLDPFAELEGSFPALRRWARELPQDPAIRIEVSEDDKAYKVKAELPGVKKDDIAVDVEGNRVSIAAEVKRETEEKKDEKVVHSERYYGHQARTFTLAREIDRKGVVAKFADGVLELTLPKNGASKSERIAIQ